LRRRFVRLPEPRLPLRLNPLLMRREPRRLLRVRELHLLNRRLRRERRVLLEHQFRRDLVREFLFVRKRLERPRKLQERRVSRVQ
jgi:hypothetical protein